MRITEHDPGCYIAADGGDGLLDCDRGQVCELLRRNGYVYFSGFAATLDEFDQFTSRFGDCEEIRSVHYPPGGEALGYHAEDAYNPYRPDALWFFCQFEGSDGGAPTGVVDGVALLAALPTAWREFVRDNHLSFDRQWSADVWQAAVGTADTGVLEAALALIPGLTYEFLGDGSLYAGYEVPMVVWTADGQESLSNTMLQAVTEPSFYGMALAAGPPVPEELILTTEALALAAEIEVGWGPREIALIDNSRMMHRRAEYSGKDRDLRARHCRDIFGSVFLDTTGPVAAGARALLQGDRGDPVRVGRPQLRSV